MNKHLLISFLILCFAACSPIITKQITKSYQPNQNDTITVYNVGEPIDYAYEVLGAYKVENPDFSKLSNYNKVIDYAKNEARSLGGNSIKIIEHIKPHAEVGFGVIFKPKHDVVFKVLSVSALKNQMNAQQCDSINSKGDATIFIYEQKNAYAAHFNRKNPIELHALSRGYGYPILLDDSLVVKMGLNWKKSIVHTQKFGNHTLTAKEKHGNFTIPIKIEKGKDYFVRFKYSISGRRIFENVDNELGEFEFSIVE